MRAFFLRPYSVMGVVIAMYVIKVFTKLTIGQQINSPMIIADGYHNLADIFEALLVIGTIYFSRLPNSTRYPFGRKNIESLFSVAVGITLMFMAVRIALDSILILGHLVGYQFGYAETPPVIPLKMGEPYGWFAGFVTLGGAIISINISTYQILVGRKTGHQALVADGQETRSDGMIELTAFAGVCGEYIFHAAWIEYVFALIVVFFMLRTGWEIFFRGLGGVLQRSIGEEHDEAITRLIERVPGVQSVAQLKSFQVGEKVILILKIITLADAHAQRLLKQGMAPLIADYLRAQEFKDGEFFIRFDEPDPERHRIAIAQQLTKDVWQIAGTIGEMARVAICDVEHGKIVRVTIHPVYLSTFDLIEFLQYKRVHTLYLFDPTSDVPDFAGSDIELVQALSTNPASLGK